MSGTSVRHSDVPVLAPARRGFTLIELLTVIAVIGILSALVLVVGGGVLGNQRVKQTEHLLLNLDRALDEYVIARGAIPEYIPEDYEDVPGDDNGLQTYGSNPENNEHCARPDAAVFIRQTRGFGEVDAIVSGIPDRFLRLTIEGTDPESVEGDPTPSVVDSWAEPGWPQPIEDEELFPINRQQVVYYVHPKNALAQDLYGRCVNGRPYFMSAGPDELYGLTNEPAAPNATVEQAERFVEDNIYSYAVGPIKKGMSESDREWDPQ